MMEGEGERGKEAGGGGRRDAHRGGGLKERYFSTDRNLGRAFPVS